jgi:hypothetical protein
MGPIPPHFTVHAFKTYFSKTKVLLCTTYRMSKRSFLLVRRIPACLRMQMGVSEGKHDKVKLSLCVMP